MKRSNSYEDTFSIDTKRKTAEKTRLRHTYTLLLNMPLSIVWMKGFLDSFFKAKEPAVNALAYAQLMVRRCEYYFSKVNKKFGKSFRNVHIECAEYLVKYHAADDRVALVPGQAQRRPASDDLKAPTQKPRGQRFSERKNPHRREDKKHHLSVHSRTYQRKNRSQPSRRGQDRRNDRADQQPDQHS